MLFLVATFLFGMLLAGLFVSVLMAVGWRDKYASAVRAANRNAGYWAESESKLYDAEAELNEAQATIREGKVLIGQYDHVIAFEKGRADEMSRIAKEALKIAHHKEFTPNNPRQYECRNCSYVADTDRVTLDSVCPECVARDMREVDLTLDAKEIG